MRDEEAEVYRLHAKMPVYGRRVARAKDLVRRALFEVPGDWGVGCSGGKDSTALVHLCIAAGWRGRLFHFRFQEHPEANKALVGVLGQAFSLEIVDVVVPGDFDTFERIGHFFAIPETAEEISAVRDGERRYKAAVEAASRAAGFDGLFWGMRADESRARRITLRTHGPIYKAATRDTWTACPLADWTGRDVWAYIVAHGLPYLSRYDQSMLGRERERSETTFLAFDALWRRGQGRRLRERDPASWAQLVQRWPGLRDWG